jgi:hypothetical protein
MSDIDRQSSKLAEHYIENHLRTDPNGGQSSSKMKRELEAFYQTTEPTLVRYTLRKIAHSPKTILINISSLCYLSKQIFDYI